MRNRCRALTTAPPGTAQLAPASGNRAATSVCPESERRATLHHYHCRPDKVNRQCGWQWRVRV